MKKIILLLTFTSFLFSCNNDDDNSSSSNNNNNGNSFTNSMDYEFTITINGEVHKVKGNTTNGIPVGGQYSSGSQNISIMNSCLTSSSSTYLSINDVTASNYISGQNLICGISFPNLLLGVNQANVGILGAYFDSICESLGGISGTFSTKSGSSYFDKNNNILPITITDLGTTSKTPIYNGINPYNFGETLKGNYSGTIYLSDKSKSLGDCKVPLQLSIDFKALRMY